MNTQKARTEFHKTVNSAYETMIQDPKLLNSPPGRQFSILKKLIDQFPHVHFDSIATWFCCSERQLKAFEKEAIEAECNYKKTEKIGNE